MEFFNSAIEVLQTLVVALGAGLGVWGAINLLEGYGNDNPGSKSQGMKQLMAGGGVALVGITLIPLWITVLTCADAGKVFCACAASAAVSDKRRYCHAPYSSQRVSCNTCAELTE